MSVLVRASRGIGSRGALRVWRTQENAAYVLQRQTDVLWNGS